MEITYLPKKTLLYTSLTLQKRTFVMYVELNEKNWGLWSHASWREMAVGGSYLITTAFFSYVMGNLSNECASYSRGFATLAIGFFVPYTAVQFPRLQKANELKSESLGVYNSISRQLTELEKKYALTPEETQSEQIILFSQLLIVIKSAAYDCLNNQANVKASSHEHLLITKRLMTTLLEHLKHFSGNLPDSATQLNKSELENELLFWMQKPQTLKDKLIAANDMEEPQERLAVGYF